MCAQLVGATPPPAHASRKARSDVRAAVACASARLEAAIARRPPPQNERTQIARPPMLAFVSLRRMNLVTDANGNMLFLASMGLGQYAEAARSMGYTGDVLMKLSAAQVEDMAFHLNMQPGHRVQLQQMYSQTVEACRQHAQQFVMQQQANAAAQAQVDAAYRAQNACPRGGVHDWQTQFEGTKICGKCFAFSR
jgi:hypothetical protein